MFHVEHFVVAGMYVCLYTYNVFYAKDT